MDFKIRPSSAINNIKQIPIKSNSSSIKINQIINKKEGILPELIMINNQNNPSLKLKAYLNKPKLIKNSHIKPSNNSNSINVNNTNNINNNTYLNGLHNTYGKLTNIEKLIEENNNFKQKINGLIKENSDLKCEIAKKEQENNKDKRLLMRIFKKEECLVNVFSEEYFKVKESQLINKLKDQFKMTKSQLKLKENEIFHMKRLLKYTKIQEFQAECKVLKEEIMKMNEIIKGNLKEVESLRLDIRMKDLYIQRNLIKNNNQQGINHDDLKTSSFYEINNNITNITNLINSNTNHNQNQNQNELDSIAISKIYSKEDAFKLIDEIKKLITNDNSFKTELINTLNLSVSLIPHEIQTEIEKLKMENQILTKNLLDLKQKQEEDDSNLLDKARLSDLSEHTKSQLKRLKKKEGVNQKHKLRLHYSLTDVNLYNKKDIFLKEESQTNKEIDYEKESNEDKSKVKPSLLNEDELNEYTYVLIKNIESLNISEEDIEEFIFDEKIETLNALYNKFISLLNLTDRNEKDNLQNYLITLNIICENNFLEVKEKFLSFFEAISSYSHEQIDLYDYKIRKKLGEYSTLLEKEFKKYDSEKKGLISFENLREVINKLDIQLKDNYIEYLIYKMKVNIPEEVVKKMDFLEYFSVLKLLKDRKNQKIDCVDYENSNDEQQNNDNSSLDEEDLKAGLDFNSVLSKNESKENNITEKIEKEYSILNKEGNNLKENQYNSSKSHENHKENEENEEKDDIEISVNEFNTRNEKVLYTIADYLLKNKLFVSNLFSKDSQIQISSHSFFDLLSKINIKLDTLDQLCLLIKLGDGESEGDFININKLKEEMTNYGIIEGTPYSVTNKLSRTYSKLSDKDKDKDKKR